MGQVPVRVMGQVKLGDYILPSGNNNGFGIAVSPSAMTATDYKKVVGVAWSESTNPKISEINVAVGLNANSLSNLVEAQSQKLKSQEDEILALKASLDETKSSINQTNSILAKLVRGFKDASGMKNVKVKKNSTSQVNKSIKISENSLVQPKEQIKTVDAADSDASKFLTREKAEEIVQMAQDMAIKSGNDANALPYFKQYNTNPVFRELALQSLQTNVNNAIRKNMNQQNNN